MFELVCGAQDGDGVKHLKSSVFSVCNVIAVPCLISALYTPPLNIANVDLSADLIVWLLLLGDYVRGGPVVMVPALGVRAAVARRWRGCLPAV